MPLNNLIPWTNSELLWKDSDLTFSEMIPVLSVVHYNDELPTQEIAIQMLRLKTQAVTLTPLATREKHDKEDRG